LQKNGSADFQYDSVEEIFKEIARVTPIYQGITYERIEKREFSGPVERLRILELHFFIKTSFSKGKVLSFQFLIGSLRTGRSRIPFLVDNGKNRFPLPHQDDDRCFSFPSEAEQNYMEITL